MRWLKALDHFVVNKTGRAERVRRVDIKKIQISKIGRPLPSRSDLPQGCGKPTLDVGKSAPFKKDTSFKSRWK